MDVGRVEILDERVLCPTATACGRSHHGGQVIESRPWLEPVGEAVRAVARRHWERAHRQPPNPRRDNEVHRHVRLPLDHVEQALAHRLAAGFDHPLLHPDASAFVDVGTGRQVSCSLQVKWCTTALPVWLRVVPWWRDQTLLVVCLRNRRRWRYPRRYFDAAHDALDIVARMTQSPGRPSDPPLSGRRPPVRLPRCWPAP